MKIREKDIKDIVRSKYDQIVKNTTKESSSSCCGDSNCCDNVDYTVFSDDYSHLPGYYSDADLSLGCGIPSEYAAMQEGNTILDLGSGAGNDCFIARNIVGEKGRVIGVDFAQNMLQKARENAAKLGFDNVEFVESDIENLQIDDKIIDVVISNCVLNLVPDKSKAFNEIYRVLKKGGHFCVSDVVISGNLPETLKNDAEMYAGCVAGAMKKDDYLNHIREQGFKSIEVKKEKKIIIPDSTLLNYMGPDELRTFKESNTGIFSITVIGSKE